MPARYPKAVLSLTGWKLPDVIAAIDGKKNVIPAYDPLQEEFNSSEADFSYMRLPGPAGHQNLPSRLSPRSSNRQRPSTLTPSKVA